MATNKKIHLGGESLFIARWLLILAGMALGGFLLWYTTSSNPHTVRTTVFSVQQVTRTEGDKEHFYTSVDYYVHTEAGTFSIPTSGLNAYPHLAGALQQGGCFTLTVSGVSIPFLGMYQRVIAARKEEAP